MKYVITLNGKEIEVGTKEKMIHRMKMVEQQKKVYKPTILNSWLAKQGIVLDENDSIQDIKMEEYLK